MNMDAREKLLAAGTHLFAQKGFAAVSIRELAIAAKTNSALISYYFGGKEGLYAAVLEVQFAPVDSIIAKLKELRLSPLERIAAYAQGVLQIHSQNPHIVRFLYSEFANPTPVFGTIQCAVQKIYDFLHQTIEEGMACGQLRKDINPSHAVLAIASMMNFYFLSRPLRQAFLPASGEQDAHYFADALNIYLNGVKKHDDQ